MKYIFSIIIILCAFFVNAQTEETEENLSEKDSVEVKKPKKDFRPYEVKIAANIFRSGKTVTGVGYNSHEVQGALSLYKYIIFADLGFEKNKRDNSFKYINSGSYFRFGFDKNFIGKPKKGNVLGVGLRYARASFKDELKGQINSIYGNGEVNLSNEKLSARWFEAVADLRGKLFSNLYAGFTLRWQFAKKINGENILKAYDVPGYGTLKRSTAFMFDYYLAWRIPFKKNEEIKEEK